MPVQFLEHLSLSGQRTRRLAFVRQTLTTTPKRNLTIQLECGGRVDDVGVLRDLDGMLELGLIPWGSAIQPARLERL